MKNGIHINIFSWLFLLWKGGNIPSDYLVSSLLVAHAAYWRQTYCLEGRCHHHHHFCYMQFEYSVLDCRKDYLMRVTLEKFRVACSILTFDLEKSLKWKYAIKFSIVFDSYWSSCAFIYGSNGAVIKIKLFFVCCFGKP